MTERSHPLDWAAPLLIGASAAVAAEVAMGLLIYAGEGFIRSLTTVLAVEGMALGVGLWVAPAPGPHLVDRLRRRWLLCIAAYVVATCFGIVWSVVPGIGTGALEQGLGLTLLAALPLLACGTVLGGMGSVARSGLAGGLRQPGAPSALGAGLGFVLTGLLLPRAPIPASLLVGCLVLISGGGLVYGVVLSSRAGRVEAEEDFRALEPATVADAVPGRAERTDAVPVGRSAHREPPAT
jgi:hypothetical protein